MEKMIEFREDDYRLDDIRPVYNTGRITSVIAESGKPPRQYGTGRRCATRECGAILSRYNPADTCFLHSRRLAQIRLSA